MSDPGGPVAIIAGAGQLPIELADHLKAAGRPHFILAFRGFATTELRRRADAVCDLLDIAAIQRHLESWSPEVVTLAGAVRRPGLSALLGAFSLLRNRREVQEIVTGGDDHVLRGAVRLLEERGFQVVGAHELAPGLVVEADLTAGVPAREEEHPAVQVGLEVLASLALFDIGQAVVVANRRVLAIEGPEGTDRMLQRVAYLRRSWSGKRSEGGVLVKAAKRGQDLRVDMPAIGPRTVTEAARAGLTGIAVGAGSTFILDREITFAMANRLGLSIASVALPWTIGE